MREGSLAAFRFPKRTLCHAADGSLCADPPRGRAVGQDEEVRVGTWNLEGHWSQDHLGLLAGLECDVWLLTEVRDDTSVPGFGSHFTAARMGERKHWAGVFSRSPIDPLPDPHPASVDRSRFGGGWGIFRGFLSEGGTSDGIDTEGVHRGVQGLGGRVRDQ